MQSLFELLSWVKQSKLSEKVHEARLKVLNTLKGEYISPELLTYFPNLESEISALDGLSETYARLQKGKLTESQRVNLINELQKQSLPYKDHEHEPAQVTQIKKILNALYHAELSLLTVEKLSLDGSASGKVSDFSTLFGAGSENVYQAVYLLTHVDYDLQALFQEEIDFLLPLFAKLDNAARGQIGVVSGFVSGYKKETLTDKTLFEKDRVYLKANHDSIDYAVIDKEGTLVGDTLPVDEVDYEFTLPITDEQLNQAFVQILQATTKRGYTQLIHYGKREYAEKVGIYTGIGVNQLKPKTGTPDFAFLTQFTGELPEKINQLTEYIKSLSDEEDGATIRIDPEKVEELRDQALKLLFALENTQSGTFILSFKAVNYVHIIRHAINISLSIVEEASNLNDSSRATVCSKIAQLKKVFSEELIGAGDKLEESLMLKPGVLSSEIQKQVTKLYDVIVQVADKYVDFVEVQPDLLTLEDSVVVRQRSDKALFRQAKIYDELDALERKQLSAKRFFSRLKQDDIKNQRLGDLPVATKHELAKRYHDFQSYVVGTAAFKDEEIVKALNKKDVAPWYSPGYLFTFVKDAEDSAGYLLKSESKILAAIAKDIETKRFQLGLNKALVQSIRQSPQALKLYPLKPNKDFLKIDEQHVLGGTDCDNLEFQKDSHGLIVQSSEHLLPEQCAILFRHYQNQRLKIDEAKEAFSSFHTLLKESSIIDLGGKELERLKRLYSTFQPYYVNLVASGESEKDNVYSLISELSARNPNRSLVRTLIGVVQGEQSRFNLRLEHYQQLAERRADNYIKLRTEIQLKENTLKPLEPLPQGARAHFVFKQEVCSSTLSKVKASLQTYTELFNEAAKKELVPAKEGLPFPDVEKTVGTYSQSSQMLLMKRISNAVYHLEQAFVHLEKLDDRSMQAIYVKNITNASLHLYNLSHLLCQVNADPYSSLVYQDVVGKIQQAYEQTLDFIKPYVPALHDEESAEEEVSVFTQTDDPETNSVIMHTLNALAVIPQHIKVLYQGEPLTRAQVSECQKHAKQLSVDIQNIIDSSNSYFKLAMKVPTMYRLFNLIKSQIQIVTESTHDAVLDHLEDIREKGFPQIVLELDHWEDQFALKPGTLSGPMSEVLEAYFIGLTETLELPSNRHMSLIRSTKPFDLRLADASKRKVATLRALTEDQEQVSHADDILKHLAKYKRIRATGEKTDLALTKALHQQLIPMIEGIRANAKGYEMEATQTVSCLEDLLDHDGYPDVDKIERVIRECRGYYEGLVHSSNLKIATIDEKIAYLNQQLSNKKTIDEQYTQAYTEKLFTQTVEKFASKEFGIIHTEHGYRDALTTYLFQYKKEVVQKAKECEDIREKVVDELSKKIGKFEADNYEDYAQLNRIVDSLLSFRIYFTEAQQLLNNQSFTFKPLFENEDTLRGKKKLINDLIDIAKNEVKGRDLPEERCLTVKQRIEKIQKEVKKGTFTTTLTKCHAFDQGWWNKLKHFVCGILEAVHLYTPEYKSQFQTLKKAAMEKPSLAKASSRFGLFSKLILTQNKPEKGLGEDPSMKPS